jgi:hypothetical protein
MSRLLPVATYVKVTPPDGPPFVARIVGYDMGHTKYEVGRRYGGWGRWLFADGGTWVLPHEVEAIGAAEAQRIYAESAPADV